VYEITHDDLYSKPSWFTDLNPAGLIPVIAWTPEAPAAAAVGCAVPGVVSIRESLICNDFIEDAFPEPPVCVVTVPILHLIVCLF
jgi:glutathione S-transferase